MKNSFDLDLNEEQLDSFANAAVQYNIEKQLRLRYEKILAKNKNEFHKKESLFHISSIVKIAAIVVAILASVFLIQESFFTTTTQSFAHALLDQTNISGNPDITRKGINSASTLRREANDAYTLKDYSLAITKYEELNTQKEIESLDQFYLGICHLKTNNYSEAIQLFSKLRADENFETGENDWLLSLAYVLSNQEQKAVPILQKVITEKKYKTKEAEKLLKRLK